MWAWIRTIEYARRGSVLLRREYSAIASTQ